MIPDLLLALMGVPGDVFELDPTSNDLIGRGGVLVVGPMVDEPLRLAQRLCRAGAMELVLAPAADALPQTSEQLAITPFIPMESRVVPAHDLEAVRVAVVAGLQRSRLQKRQSAVSMAAQRSLQRQSQAPPSTRDPMPVVLETHRDAVLAFLDAHAALRDAELPARVRQGLDIVGSLEEARSCIRARRWSSYATTLRAMLVDSPEPPAGRGREESSLGAWRRSLMGGLSNQARDGADLVQLLTGMDAFVEACEMEIADVDRRAQRAHLQRAWTRERLSGSVVESTDDAVVSTDVDGVITGWNPGAEHLYGYTEDEAVGRSIEELLWAVDRGYGERGSGRRTTARGCEGGQVGTQVSGSRTEGASATASHAHSD